MSLTADEVLEQFELAWQTTQPELDEALRRFQEPAEQPADERRDLLVELIKIDLEFRWRRSMKAGEHETVVSAADESETLAGRAPAVEPRLLQEYLKTYPEIAEHLESVVDLAGEEFRARMRWGDRPAVEEFLGELEIPDSALRDRLLDIRRELAADSLIPGSESTSGDRNLTSDRPVSRRATMSDKPESLPAEFGGYELLEEIGVGGMGTVYRAVQRSAGRTVALKVIRPDLLQGMSAEGRQALIDRFHNEALAAARLEHDHIVRVYEVGQAGGAHFFSMQWVRGASLSSVVQQGPLESKTAGAYVESVAHALAAAHRQGVLHRDLKPQNVLLDSETDRPLVADFGLAKLLDSSDELTRHGDVMGTPQYMAPEQAEGKTVTELSDVYGLGATLYHLVTGRPPFQSATVKDVIRQVLFDEAVAPRKLDPGIDRDMETICLKCLEKEPARRYRSASDLAADLERYRLGKPLKARPLNAVERIWRWSQRNRVVAALSGVIIALVLVALVGTSLGYRSANIARRASEDGFVDARVALDDLVERIRDERALDEPPLHRLKDGLLQQALTYYQRFLRKRANDPSLVDEVAQTYYRVGLLQEEIVSPDAALASFQSAIDIQRSRITAKPSDAGPLQALGTTLNAKGKTLAKKDLLDQAHDAFVEAARLRKHASSLAVDAETADECRRLQANTQMNLGILAKRVGDFDQALQHYESAQGIRQSILESTPSNEAVERDLGKGYYNIGHLQVFLGREEPARTNLQKAAAQFEQLIESFHTPANQLALAQCYRLLADIDVNPATAIELYEKARTEAQFLVDDQPVVELYQEQLSEINTNLGQTLHDDGRLEAAIHCYQTAIEILVGLKAKELGVPSQQRNLALNYQLLAEAQLQREQSREARENLKRAQSELVSLAETFDDENDHAALEEVQGLLESLPR